MSSSHHVPPMHGEPSPQTLSIGQVAKRWRVGRQRIRKLVEAGQLTAFRIPSAGRLGQAIRIPLSAVLEAEADWALVPPAGAKVRRNLAPPSVGPLRHFPGLGPAAECREDGTN